MQQYFSFSVYMYMWRHLDVQADWSIRSGSQRHRDFVVTCPSKHRHGVTFFIRLFRETAPFSHLLNIRFTVIRRIHSRLNPPPPGGGGVKIRAWQLASCVVWETTFQLTVTTVYINLNVESNIKTGRILFKSHFSEYCLHYASMLA